MTGKFSVLHDSLGPVSVFYLCESLILSHKALDDSGSKKILNLLLLLFWSHTKEEQSVFTLLADRNRIPR